MMFLITENYATLYKCKFMTNKVITSSNLSTGVVSVVQTTDILSATLFRDLRHEVILSSLYIRPTDSLASYILKKI